MFVISKCSGDTIISYMEVYAIFCERIDFDKIFVMSLDFAHVKTTLTCARNDIHDLLSPSTALFLFISDETI